MPVIPKIGKQWIFIVMIAILFFMVLGLNSRIAEYFRLTGQREEMLQRIENLKATQATLKPRSPTPIQTRRLRMGTHSNEWCSLATSDHSAATQGFHPDINYLATPAPPVGQNCRFGGNCCSASNLTKSIRIISNSKSVR